MKKTITAGFLLFISMLLGACSNVDKNHTIDDKSVVEVYYINAKASGLASEPYNLIGTEKEEQVKELLYMLKKKPEDIAYKSAMTDNVIVKDFSFNEDGQLTINFESAYDEMTGISEVLCRAVIVKTICQLPDVEYIQFNVNGQPLMDSDGVVGLLTKEDFIDSTGGETNYKVKLYFANEDGKALVEYVTDINYSGTGSIEELVIEKLIEGPTELGMYRTIPEGASLLNVTKKDGICYVDFDKKFLEKLPNVTAQITIYSIVDSLVELPNINKVQFMINGEVIKTFQENTTFDGFFERNLSLIEGSN